MRVKPKEGMLVRRPAPSFLPIPPEGADVPNVSYFRRRIKDGDLLLIQEKVEEKVEEKEKRKPAKRRSTEESE